MPESEHGDLLRLGNRVMRERMARKWSKEAAARHAGINSVTWDRVERGVPRIQDTTYAAIAKALRWRSDGCLRILANLEPEPLDEPEPPEPTPKPESEDPYVADLQERYGLDPTGAQAAAAVIRALRPNGDNSANPGIREA